MASQQDIVTADGKAIINPGMDGSAVDPGSTEYE